MIIQRDGNLMLVTLPHSHPVGNFTLTIKHDFESEFQARLQVHNIQTAFSDLVETIRREEYEKGWKDAKSHKRPKKNWFARYLEKGRA